MADYAGDAHRGVAGAGMSAAVGFGSGASSASPCPSASSADVGATAGAPSSAGGGVTTRCFPCLRCCGDSEGAVVAAGSGGGGGRSGSRQKRGRCRVCCGGGGGHGAENRPAGNETRRWRVVLTRVVHSICWSAIVTIFTLILFFGNQVQYLWCPASSDAAWDVAFTTAFVVLGCDLVIRSLVEPGYFVLRLGGKDRRCDRIGSGGGGGLGSDGVGVFGCGCGRNKCFRIGSFMFWCDLVSTLTLLYDISFINKSRQMMQTIDVTIDRMGFPTEGVRNVNDPSPVETQMGALEIVLAVCKTARVAHFIRTMAVFNTSSRFSLYTISRYFDPFYWFGRCFRRRRDRDQGGAGGGGGGLLSHMTDAAPRSGFNGGGPPNLLSSKYSNGGGVSGSTPSPPPHYRKRNLPASSFSRRASFSSSARNLAALDHAASSAARRGGGSGLFRVVLSAFGSGSKEEARRNASAVKIQRFWRRSRGYGNRVRRGTVAGSKEAGSAGVAAKSVPSSRGFGFKSAAKSVIRLSGGGSSSGSSKRDAGSQVGFAMRELTGQRVAIGIMIALVFTVLFTYDEENATAPTAMVLLHNQTQNARFATRAVEAARATSVQNLYEYTFVDGTAMGYPIEGTEPALLREREKMRITVTDVSTNTVTSGLFSIRKDVYDLALVELVSTIFILMIWFSGVTAFAGPVMTLVVVPIERMIRLLNMLMDDPLGNYAHPVRVLSSHVYWTPWLFDRLTAGQTASIAFSDATRLSLPFIIIFMWTGYQGSCKYEKFLAEEDEFIKNTMWTKDVLKGMETSFLMSTILRIGSLMKVGFGSAGVEIIQGNLKKGQKKEDIALNTQGSTVNCIFLFCDIRQFTDATECLQEEVFVFTNKIAAVVHSYCAAYDGSANKNVGDAFLMSWLLDDPSKKRIQGDNDGFGGGVFGGKGGFGGGALSGSISDDLTAKHNEADKCLLSVVKICIALYHEKFFLESMSDNARGKLLAKIAKRKGTVVQMGFGLHAGKAVQGALGSQRKLDATYVGEVVDRAEFLESSTKQYGLKMLMSGDFHKLLHPSNRRRCRKINQVVFVEQDDFNEGENIGLEEVGDVMELFTFDMDVDALWRHTPRAAGDGSADDPSTHNLETMSESDGSLRPSVLGAEAAAYSLHSRRDLTLFSRSKKGLPEADLRASRRRRVSLIRGRSGSYHARADDGVSDTTSVRKASFSGSAGDVPSSAAVTPRTELNERGVPKNLPELELPTGREHYNASVWVNEEMRRLRHRFSDGIFFQKFSSGLKSYFSRDWEHARHCFLTILERIEDGPSRYFLGKIEASNGVPPRDFSGYERA